MTDKTTEALDVVRSPERLGVDPNREHEKVAERDEVSSMTRERSIVRLAAGMTETPYLRHWFLADERGVWEKNAADYLTRTAERATALGMTEAEVNDAIAVELCVLGLSAMIEERKSRKTG